MNREAWSEPATPGDVADTVGYCLTLIEGTQAAAERTPIVARAIAQRGYSRAELLAVAHELPFRNNFGQGFRLDLLDEIVRERRALVRALDVPCDEGTMLKLCRENEGIEPEHWHRCGFDDRSRPLVRYAPDLKPRTAPEHAAYEPPDDVRRLPDGRKVRHGHPDFQTGRPTALSLLVQRHARLPMGCSDDNVNYPPRPPAPATRIPSPAEARQQRERAEREARVAAVRATDEAWTSLAGEEQARRLDEAWERVQREHPDLALLGRDALHTSLVNQAKATLAAELEAAA